MRTQKTSKPWPGLLVPIHEGNIWLEAEKRGDEEDSSIALRSISDLRPGEKHFRSAQKPCTVIS